MKLLTILFILISLCPVVAGTPIIDSYNNSISNTNMYPVVDYGANIQFNASANETITLWVWMVDGVNQSNNHDNLTYAWSDKGYKNTTVTATNANGTTTILMWNPYVNTEMAGPADTVDHMNESGYDTLMDGIGGDGPDFEVVLYATTEPYQAIMGNMFFIVLFGLPAVMMWMRQGSLLIPSMYGIIFGTTLFAFFPTSFAATASAIIIMSVLGTFYAFYKERK